MCLVSFVIIRFCPAFKETSFDERLAESSPAVEDYLSRRSRARRKAVSVLIARARTRTPKSIVSQPVRKIASCVVHPACRIGRDRSNTPMIALLRANVTDVTELRKAGSHARARARVCTCAWKDKSLPAPPPPPRPRRLSHHPEDSLPFPSRVSSSKCSRDGPWTVGEWRRGRGGERSIPSAVDLTRMRYRMHGNRLRAAPLAPLPPAGSLFGQSARPSGKWKLPARDPAKQRARVRLLGLLKRRLSKRTISGKYLL